MPHGRLKTGLADLAHNLTLNVIGQQAPGSGTIAQRKSFGGLWR